MRTLLAIAIGLVSLSLFVGGIVWMLWHGHILVFLGIIWAVPLLLISWLVGNEILTSIHIARVNRRNNALR